MDVISFLITGLFALSCQRDMLDSEVNVSDDLKPGSKLDYAKLNDPSLVCIGSVIKRTALFDTPTQDNTIVALDVGMKVFVIGTAREGGDCMAVSTGDDLFGFIDPRSLKIECSGSDED